MYKADKRIYVTADRSRVVEEDDPRAAVLLVAEGGEIQDAEAERYGLTGKGKGKAPEGVVVHSIAADPPKDDVPAEDDEADDDKAKGKAQAPAEDKAQRAPGRKDDGK